MKKLILVICVVFFISACAPTFQPVTSLEELMPKEEMEKKKDWVKNTRAGVTMATGAGATLVLLPLALVVIASTPKIKELTVSEISDVAATAIYDFDGAYILYSARDGGGGDITRVVVIGEGKQGAGEIKPFALYFFRYKDRVEYYEGGVVKKENNGDYYYWKIPLLKKKGEAIVYSLDESLKLKKNIPSLGFENRIDLIFEKDSSFEEVYKNKHSVIPEIKDYFIKNNPQMIKIKCANGSSCATKEVRGEAGE
jgi:hypothetical protein